MSAPIVLSGVWGDFILNMDNVEYIAPTGTVHKHGDLHVWLYDIHLSGGDAISAYVESIDELVALTGAKYLKEAT